MDKFFKGRDVAGRPKQPVRASDHGLEWEFIVAALRLCFVYKQLEIERYLIHIKPTVFAIKSVLKHSTIFGDLRSEIRGDKDAVGDAP